ncbi:MAG TPA: glycerol-3-phosphate 1-O-acyltransferase PlsY [Candidatus Obscuribacterales bacterium]
MNTALLILFSYVLGSIPTGYWLVKALKGIDLTKVGSGSTGTTNVLRNAGKGAAIVVFLIDILKGYIPVTLGIYAVHHNWVPELAAVPGLDAWLPCICGIISMIGHSKSMFLQFKGGKSAATGCGTLIGCSTLSGFTSLGFWGLVLFVTKIVSVASLAAAATCGVFMWFYTQGDPKFHISFSIYATVGGLYVITRHKANIERLLKGTEPRIGQKLQQQDDASGAPSDKIGV